MNKVAVIIAGILLILLAVRLFRKPLKLILRLGLNSLAGLAILFFFHFLQPFTGIYVGINLFSALLTGFLGLPGAALLLLLAKFL